MKLRSPASILLIFSSLVLVAGMLGGCGQRGPLRLPVLPPEVAAPPAPAKPAPAKVPTTSPAVIETAPK